MLKIGITERGDAGINLSWTHRMNEVSGAILITKKITASFGKALLAQKTPCILHCTCTGWGGSPIEFNVFDLETQLGALKALIEAGFPAERIALRIDPIFPSKSGLDTVKWVLEEFHKTIEPLGVKRIRFSVVDEYRHVKERYRTNGWTPLYGDNFNANEEQMKKVYRVLETYNKKYGYIFESCAEPRLPEAPFIERRGCISVKDLELMDIAIPNNISTNPQNRRGCMCLSCKTELLDSKHPCKNGCVYCYWKS